MYSKELLSIIKILATEFIISRTFQCERYFSLARPLDTCTGILHYRPLLVHKSRQVCTTQQSTIGYILHYNALLQCIMTSRRQYKCTLMSINIMGYITMEHLFIILVWYPSQQMQCSTYHTFPSWRKIYN